jgi:hypothetical protein
MYIIFKILADQLLLCKMITNHEFYIKYSSGRHQQLISVAWKEYMNDKIKKCMT